MDNQTPPTPKKYLRIRPEDLAKVSKARDAEANKITVDEEWYSISEFGKHYGWAAIQAVLNNEITFEEMMVLLQGARKYDYGQQYANTTAAFVGAVAAQSKKPTKTFKAAMKDILKAMKADK